MFNIKFLRAALFAAMVSTSAAVSACWVPVATTAEGSTSAPRPGHPPDTNPGTPSPVPGHPPDTNPKR